MKLLVKKQKRQSIGNLNEITINKTTVTMLSETLDVNGLKHTTHFGIGSMENGTLIAIFGSERHGELLKLSQPFAKSKRNSVTLMGENKRVMARYQGTYRMTEQVDLMEDAVCYVLKPILK